MWQLNHEGQDKRNPNENYLPHCHTTFWVRDYDNRIIEHGESDQPNHHTQRAVHELIENEFYTVYNATSKQFFFFFFLNKQQQQKLYYEDESKFIIKSITRVKNWVLQTAEKWPEPT